MKKATRQQTKDHNTRLILKTLFDNDSLSRADIARVTRLTRPTVSNIVADLIDAQLVLETGIGPSAGGKPPILLEVNYDAHHMLAVDLGSRDYRAARINLRGEIVHRIEQRGNGGQNGEEALAQTIRMIDEILAADDTPVLGLGLGAPGVIVPSTGMVRNAVNLGWYNVPVRTLLEARYDLPVYVVNDSHAAALAEYTFGGERENDNLILLKVSQGIGAGIILGGRPFSGDGYGAGEIGHLVVQAAGSRCTCGNHGCLETIAGTRAILRRAGEALHTADVDATAMELSWSEFAQRHTAGERPLVEVVAETGRYLGVALAGLVAGFNVETIVIAGRVTDVGDSLLEAARTEARRRALPSMVDETIIRYSPLGVEMVLLGCSALVLQQELGIV